MINIVISFLTFVLIIISLFMILVILMQRANSNAGMGSAFGGGVTESAFGADTANVLVRATKWASVGFFLLALALYLLYMRKDADASRPVESDLPDIPVAAQSVSPEAAQEAAATQEAAAAQNSEAAVDEADNAAESTPDP